MRILALDTATPCTVAAILNDRQVVGEFAEASRNHSVTLLPAIDKLLVDLGTDRNHIEAIAIGRGPGSFTGLRVGLAIAKTMAFSMKVPLVGVSSLQALACNGESSGVDRICPMLDALKNEIYCSEYILSEQKLTEVQAEDARDPGRWAESLARRSGRCMLLGTGAQRYRKVLSEVLGDLAVFPGDESLHQIRAGSVGGLGLTRLKAGETDDPYELEPSYCRLSEAELARQAKKS